MDSSLEQQIEVFSRWRETVSGTLSEYRTWLDQAGITDAMQDLRLFDMTETLRKDHIVLAFVAEFSRGKTETINALFFADFNQRLLPSEAGRTTMCPTEIFWSADQEPSITLLPIETRKGDDTLNFLKANSTEWVRHRLDTTSPSAMREALYALVEQKEVSLEEAQAIGLWNPDDIAMAHGLETKGTVTVPAWRHAMINYPHPLLKSGLVILDTPGLNTLGAEPELTLSIISNAHAVIFLLATDTGVTKSDMHIWNDHIRSRASRKLAVLNKIDILWDAMKSETEIQASIRTQVESTARQLNLPASCVLAISAQKALLAKIRKDEELLEKSGLRQVEALLADSVVATKHEIISHTVISESTHMMKASRRLIQQRLVTIKNEIDGLQLLRSASDGDAGLVMEQLQEEKERYQASLHTFNEGQQKIALLGERLMAQVNPEDFAKILDLSKQEIGDSWTTAGLNRGMRKLIAQTTALALRISEQGLLIKKSADELYKLFKTEHGLDAGTVAHLDMHALMDRMDKLQEATDSFCVDPVNLMTEKHFVVRKFFLSLGNEAKEIFAETSLACKNWITNVLKPLITQINEHKQALDQQSAALLSIHKNREEIDQRIQQTLQKLETEKARGLALDQMLLKLMKAAKPMAPVPAIAPELAMEPIEAAAS